MKPAVENGRIICDRANSKITFLLDGQETG